VKKSGGSCLILGSAAGVAAMGMEKMDFIWYLKRFSLLAFGGYFAGALFYMVQHYYLHSIVPRLMDRSLITYKGKV
jgi:hypothetical protein